MEKIDKLERIFEMQACFQKDLVNRRHLEDIVLLRDTRDFFPNDIIDHTGAVHWMHDQIPNAEHGKSFPFPVRAVPGFPLL